MNKTGIILDYDPFARESRICVMQEGNQDYSQVVSTIEEVANVIIGLAYKNNIYDVFTHAPFAVTSEIRRIVKEYERNQYSDNKIKVEGI